MLGQAGLELDLLSSPSMVSSSNTETDTMLGPAAVPVETCDSHTPVKDRLSASFSSSLTTSSVEARLLEVTNSSLLNRTSLLS